MLTFRTVIDKLLQTQSWQFTKKSVFQTKYLATDITSAYSIWVVLKLKTHKKFSRSNLCRVYILKSILLICYIQAQMKTNVTWLFNQQTKNIGCLDNNLSTNIISFMIKRLTLNKVKNIFKLDMALKTHKMW